MRRAIANTIAFFCVLTQVALGVSSTLGLVFCVGADHAGIEVASDDCCERGGATSVAMLSGDCCSDIPLYSAARPFSDVRRSAEALTAAVAIVPVALVASASGVAGCDRSSGTVDLSTRFTRRTVVLRI